MSVQDTFIDGLGRLQVLATSRPRQRPPHDHADVRVCREILRCSDGRKERKTKGSAAVSEERRGTRRHSYRLPLTLSVFNHAAVFQAEMVNYGQNGVCADTGYRVLPGTSIHLRIDTSQTAVVGKAVLQGLRTTALGEVKWCRATGQGYSPHYRIGLRYYTHF